LIGRRLGLVIVGLVVGCSNTPPATHLASAPPTPDLVAQNYVSLIHNYWIHEQTADGASNGSNLAAKVCLGMDPPGTPMNLELVDPAQCRGRAVALLANAQRFLTDLDRTPAPPKFAPDDQAFRTQLPKAIADLKALIAATDTGSKNAVLQAATAYNNDMYPIVTDALNDVDPAVSHP
jgi:hypothetical protein